jgi:heavy metal sensor kinase
MSKSEGFAIKNDAPASAPKALACVRIRSLRGRLALFYAVTLSLVLLAFAGTVWAIMEAEEASEPAAVRSLEPPERWPARLLIAIAAGLPVALGVAVGGALIISRRGLKPLDDVVATAARVGTENLGERIPERAGTAVEIAELVRALNGMLERLERSVAGMRRFTADASHELRTPLAVLLGELEVSLRRPRSADELRATVERALEELGRLASLVEALLTIARSDAGGLPLSPEPLDLVALARSAAEPYEAPLAARGIALTWEAPRPVRAQADPQWTGRAIANLLDNALKFVPSGGAVTIAVTSDDAGPVRLEVRDTGAGIEAADRERIFERFYRGEAARAGAPGAGLGLPLAREIARAQGGDLRALASERGARFVLELPARDGA